MLIAGSVAAAAIAVVVIAVGLRYLGLANGSQLDVHKTEASVQQILTDPGYGYGVDGVSDVRCNNGKNPSVKKGAGFTCTVVVNGTKRLVAVVVTDDNGTYEVDRPR